MLSTSKNYAILYLILSAFFFSLMSLFVRISGELPIYEKCFFRNAVALIAITVFMAIRREKFIPKKEAIPQIFGRSVFDYSQVIFTAIWGLIFLNQIPDYLSIIGYVIIILVAVYKWRKNLKEKLNTAVSKN